MAAYISFQPTDFFKPKLYTGNSSTNAITGVGFQPNLVWIKNRSGGASHALQDSVRGNDKSLRANTDGAEYTNDFFDSFDSDGFTVSTSENDVNVSSDNFVAWNWKESTTSGFDVVSYSGTGSAKTESHSLGVVPQLMMVKQLDDPGGGSNSWNMYHHSLGNTKYIDLNTNGGVGTGTNRWNDTTPTSSVFSVGTGNTTNQSGSSYIAYLWAEKKGFSKFGSYISNNSADGPFLYTGFNPAFVMIKSTVSGSYKAWSMFGTVRQPFNLNAGKTLYANENYGEGKRGEGSSSTTIPAIDILSNGFKPKVGNDEVNTSPDQEYIYVAFAEFPLVSSNSKAGTAR